MRSLRTPVMLMVATAMTAACAVTPSASSDVDLLPVPVVTKHLDDVPSSPAAHRAYDLERFALEEAVDAHCAPVNARRTELRELIVAGEKLTGENTTRVDEDGVWRGAQPLLFRNASACDWHWLTTTYAWHPRYAARVRRVSTSLEDFARWVSAGPVFDHECVELDGFVNDEGRISFSKVTIEADQNDPNVRHVQRQNIRVGARRWSTFSNHIERRGADGEWHETLSQAFSIAVKHAGAISAITDDVVWANGSEHGVQLDCSSSPCVLVPQSRDWFNGPYIVNEAALAPAERERATRALTHTYVIVVDGDRVDVDVDAKNAHAAYFRSAEACRAHSTEGCGSRPCGAF